MAYIVTIVAVVLSAIFALMVRVWGGFAYFLLTTLLLLSLFWFAWLMYQYFTSFRNELKEEFSLFKAKTINKYKITSEEFEANLPQYKKEFSKKMLKIKFVAWFRMAFCLACASAFLCSIILY